MLLLSFQIIYRIHGGVMIAKDKSRPTIFFATLNKIRKQRVERR